jgi:hypothetical protein
MKCCGKTRKGKYCIECGKRLLGGIGGEVMDDLDDRINNAEATVNDQQVSSGDKIDVRREVQQLLRWRNWLADKLD